MPDLTYYPEWRRYNNRVLTDQLTGRVRQALSQAVVGLDAAGVQLPDGEDFRYVKEDASPVVAYDSQGWAGKSWGEKTLEEMTLDPRRVQVKVRGPIWACGQALDSSDTYSHETGMRRTGLLRLTKAPAQTYTHLFRDHTRGINIRQEAVIVDGHARFKERIWASNWSSALLAAASPAGAGVALAGAVLGGSDFGLAGALAGGPLAFGALVSLFRLRIPGQATTREFLRQYPMETRALRTRQAWD